MIRFIHLFLAFLAFFAGNAQAVEIGRQIKIDAERPKPIVAPSAIAHLGARQSSGAAFAVPPLSPEKRTGQRSGVDQANGVATRYSYDLMGRLTGLSHKKASELLASYTYSLRADGRRSGVTEKRLEASGVLSQTSISYTYDELNRLTQEASTSDDPGAVFQTSYQYDLCGNRVKKATAGAESIDYTYNDADQLLKEASTPTSGVIKEINYGYDAGGNLISKNASTESASYAYDLEGRMVTAEIARIEQGKTVTATSQYSYNLSGTRVGAVTNGNVQGQGAFSESRKFLVDEANFTGYSQVLEEFGSTGALSRSYVIGDDILSQNRGNGSETLLADGHGSTRLLTHASGAVMERYSFDAYGVLLGGNKGISNRTGTNYLYSGEEYDDSLQMQYLRARYYDQNTGSFNALDPYAGNMQEPQSYNKYGYCHSDPVNGCDPSGMMSVSQLAVGMGVMTTLATTLYLYNVKNYSLLKSVGYGVLAGFLTAMAIIFAPQIALFFANASLFTQILAAVLALVSYIFTLFESSEIGHVLVDENSSSTQKFSAAFMGVALIANMLIGGKKYSDASDELVDPSIINFMQDTANNSHGSSSATVLSNANGLRAGEIKLGFPGEPPSPGTIPAIRIWKDNENRLWTLDHRRLVAFRIADLRRVPFKWATSKELFKDINKKFTTETDGKSIDLIISPNERVKIE